MIDPTTARAEQLREVSGMAWEHACQYAEQERDDVTRVAVIDGVVLVAPASTRGVSWCSDWARIGELGLEREDGGPGTYGHTTYRLPVQS